MTDVAIIGAGPAGISAALTVHARGKSVQVISNDPLESPLAKAGRIDNYPGMPRVSGTGMLLALVDQAAELGIEITRQRVVSVLPFGERFMVSIGADMVDAGAVILALGVGSGKVFPGEAELLGRGVSYCATCDGMLYRNRRVCVVGNTPEAEAEAGFLASIGCEVTYVTRGKTTSALPEGIPTMRYGKLEIEGDDRVTALLVHGREAVSGEKAAAGEKATAASAAGEKATAASAAGEKTVVAADSGEKPVATGSVERVECDAVFVLRPAIAPGSLVPGLETEGAFIKVDGAMKTNIPGIFAAGDCTGKPLQVARAVGQGQIAAFSAVEYVEGI